MYFLWGWGGQRRLGLESGAIDTGSASEIPAGRSWTASWLSSESGEDSKLYVHTEGTSPGIYMWRWKPWMWM